MHVWSAVDGRGSLFRLSICLPVSVESCHSPQTNPVHSRFNFLRGPFLMDDSEMKADDECGRPFLSRMLCDRHRMRWLIKRFRWNFALMILRVKWPFQCDSVMAMRCAVSHIRNLGGRVFFVKKTPNDVTSSPVRARTQSHLSNRRHQNEQTLHREFPCKFISEPNATASISRAKGEYHFESRRGLHRFLCFVKQKVLVQFGTNVSRTTPLSLLSHTHTHTHTVLTLKSHAFSNWILWK